MTPIYSMNCVCLQAYAEFMREYSSLGPIPYPPPVKKRSKLFMILLTQIKIPRSSVFFKSTIHDITTCYNNHNNLNKNTAKYYQIQVSIFRGLELQTSMLNCQIRIIIILGVDNYFMKN